VNAEAPLVMPRRCVLFVLPIHLVGGTAF